MAFGKRSLGVRALTVSLFLGGCTVDAQAPVRAFLDTYCITCHNQKLRTAGLALDNLDAAHASAQAEIWERVIAKLRAGSMPPPGRPRADAATYRQVASSLENEIDKAWVTRPRPGRVSAVHRLNRAEYNHAIRDLFALDLDVKPLLPGDETADGSFDNFADVLSISTAHLERYLSVARQVTRLATGLPPNAPGMERFEIPLHVLQDDRQSEDLPLGSRGGIAIHYDFPVDGEYLIRVRLQRQYQDYLKGMGWPQQLDVRLDGNLLKRFTVGGGGKGRPAASSYAGDGEPNFAGDPEWEKYMQLTGDAGLEVRIPVKAGPRVVGVSFVREMWEPEGLPQPLQRGRVIADDEVYMDYANVGSVQIGGPYRAVGPAKDTPSRRAIFVCQPGPGVEERVCANKILARMARLAYRRPATKADVQTLLEFFDSGRHDGGSFDGGIQYALERMLVDPDFLLRVHRPSTAAGTYRLNDLEVASRLSFFLWSSIPDDRLLTLAEHGQLTNPPTLEKEVRRMLADPRATEALVNDFAAQWLNLRRVEEVVVDPDRYPNYDESLLRAFKQETEMFVASTLREDRGVADLLDANYTFVNERLARHYGIPGIYGSRFRRVMLPNHEQRGGLLGELLARHFANETQVGSLELSMDAPANAGACTGNLSCVYTHTLSWRSPTQPLPTEWNPRAVFEKLFGDSGSTERTAREARMRQHKSMLDSVNEKLASLKKELGPQDQVKIDEYTEAIRDVERRIQRAEEQSGVELPTMEQPLGAPPVFEDHLALMYDLQLLAFRSDLTRVITFMIGKEQSARPYPQIGVPEAHHPLSHHNDLPELVATMSKINTYHVQLFSQYLAKLRATADGDGSLLDHMTILYGAGISNSNRHSGDNLPLLVVGGGAGRLKGGRHIQYSGKPSNANLLVTLMDKMDVPVERLGGSTGKLPLDTLSGV